ncbi:DUF6770 family protein [Flavobacterium suzhouense]|uniref:DUF6770 family protein n=1 Tax=Flavobacterium suzhouense TaxID=1529638 RepID=A0ABW5NV12_9FLAO
MRQIYLLVFSLFCLFSMNGQIAKLNEFSKGKLYSTSIIKDSRNNIKGYFLLFMSDKIAKETYELEYVVLDENLVKVTNGFISEMKYESWLIKAEGVKVNATLSEDNKLLLDFRDNVTSDGFISAYGFDFGRYRILDLKTNELSQPFIFNNNELFVNPVFDRKNTNWKKNQTEYFQPYDKVGLVVNVEGLLNEEDVTERYLKCYDGDLKEKWKYVYQVNPKNDLKRLIYLKSDEDVIVMLNQKAKVRGKIYVEYKRGFSILLVDSKTGKQQSEFVYPEIDKYSYTMECKLTKDKIYLMGNYYAGKLVDDVKNIGWYCFVLDKSTGNLLSKDYLKWESLAGKLDITKKGYVKKEGYLYTHNMLLQENGDVIVVTEAFINKPVTTNNLYFFKLDNKLAFKEVFEVSKFRNKLSGSNAFSGTIKRAGAFDFIDYQDLGDNEYLFFFNDNEKKSNKKKKSTHYGIVSYSDGEFKKQTLELKTETSTISAYNAKQGYILLVEDFEGQKPLEYRLEKINY